MRTIADAYRVAVQRKRTARFRTLRNMSTVPKKYAKKSSEAPKRKAQKEKEMTSNAQEISRFSRTVTHPTKLSKEEAQKIARKLADQGYEYPQISDHLYAIGFWNKFTGEKLSYSSISAFVLKELDGSRRPGLPDEMPKGRRPKTTKVLPLLEGMSPPKANLGRAGKDQTPKDTDMQGNPIYQNLFTPNSQKTPQKAQTEQPKPQAQKPRPQPTPPQYQAPQSNLLPLMQAMMQMNQPQQAPDAKAQNKLALVRQVLLTSTMSEGDRIAMSLLVLDL